MPIHNSRLFALLSVEIEGTLSWVMISQYAAVSVHYFTREVSIPFPSFSRYLYQNWVGVSFPYLWRLLYGLRTNSLWMCLRYQCLTQGFRDPNFSVFLLCVILTLAFEITSLTPPPPPFMHDYATFVVSQLKPCFRISIFFLLGDSNTTVVFRYQIP